jgi:hypothetical protein
MSSMEHSKVEAQSADERATRDSSMDDVRPYESAVEPEVNYLNNDYGWKSWLFTLDHKRIGLMYLVTISITFFLGGWPLPVFAATSSARRACSARKPTTRSSPRTA